MNKFNFDEVHNRRISGDIKYKCDKDMIPMWVADMDFKVPNEVTEALIQAAQHGIFGYVEPDEEYNELVASWYRRRFDWEIKHEWILKTPRVMFAIAAAINGLTETGDGVLICQPVYYPFSRIVSANQRTLIVSELRESDGKYEIDFADFEDKIVKNNVKMFLLCSPHNPVGRVWTRAELGEIGRICLKHNVIITADEIHSDFIFNGSVHTPLAAISEELAEITVTCTAPSKTFNLAGLQASNIIISNPEMRRRVNRAVAATGLNDMNTMAIASTKAVYKYGDEWLDSLLLYLEESKNILKDAFLPDDPVSLIEPEGTYLAWLDCRKMNLSSAELNHLFFHQAKVRLHKGETFGESGRGFVRMNFACPHSVLNEAIKRMKENI